MQDQSRGGGNTLVAGFASTTYMWGAAATLTTTGAIAADTFVFAPGDGLAFSEDFRAGLDRIDLAGFTTLKTYAALDVTVANGASTLHLGADTLTVLNDTHLAASDFRLA